MIDRSSFDLREGAVWAYDAPGGVLWVKSESCSRIWRVLAFKDKFPLNLVFPQSCQQMAHILCAFQGWLPFLSKHTRHILTLWPQGPQVLTIIPLLLTTTSSNIVLGNDVTNVLLFLCVTSLLNRDFPHHPHPVTHPPNLKNAPRSHAPDSVNQL